MNRNPGPNVYPPNQPQVQIASPVPIQLTEQQQASLPLDNTMATLVIDECHRMWSNVVLDVLKNLKSRTSNVVIHSNLQNKLMSRTQSKIQNKGRSRRDFTGKALKIASNMIIGGAVTNLVSTIWNHFDPHSNEHRITKLEESGTEILDQIDEFKERFNLTSEILDVVIGDVQNLGHRTRRLEYQINHLVQLVPRLTWTATYVQTRMMSMAANLRSMLEEYSHGRVACKEMAELLRIPDLEGIDNQWTYFESIERLQENRTSIPTYVFKFNINRRAPDTYIYRVKAFRYWDNLTETPILMDYKCYNWLLHNESSNCLAALEEPSEPIMTVACIDANYTDPRLQMWEKVAETQDIYLFNHTCQVKKAASYHYIYCFPFNITTVMGTFRNPPHVYRLPLDVAFKLPVMTYVPVIKEIEVNSSTDLDAIDSIHTSQFNMGSEAIDENKWFDKIQLLRKQNEKLKIERDNSISIEKQGGWFWFLIVLIVMLIIITA